MRNVISVLVFLLIIAGCNQQEKSKTDYHFRGSISREVLNNYLSRAVTMAELCTPPAYVQDGTSSCLDDDIRLIHNLDVKFVGRAIFRWGEEEALNDPEFLSYAGDIIREVHEKDPDVVFQAGIFEVVTPEVQKIPIPEHAFEAFRLPIQKRPFDFRAMLFEDGSFVNHFGQASVPDITRIETKLWFYTLATRYIDAGFEAIHWGQVGLTGMRDDDWKNWFELIDKVRSYANQHARRSFVLHDAHTSRGYLVDGEHLLDFNSFPLRIQESEEKRLEGVLKADYPVKERWQESIYQKSEGGITPSGWKCERLPYLVEFDNFGISDTPGRRSDVTDPFIWGYDEITWFSLKSPEEQKQWLEYAFRWIDEHAPFGHLQMPVTRVVVDGENPRHKYKANNPGENCPQGTGLESKIDELWSEN